MNVIGDNIRLQRLIKGYSQDYVASVFEKSQNWVHNIESGKTEVGDKQLTQFAELFEVTTEQLKEVRNSHTYINCNNSGTNSSNNGIYHIQNDLSEIKDLLKELILALKE
jgi:transcriptional regulator with XRE-family HTH domain